MLETVQKHKQFHEVDDDHTDDDQVEKGQLSYKEGAVEVGKHQKNGQRSVKYPSVERLIILEWPERYVSLDSLRGLEQPLAFDSIRGQQVTILVGDLELARGFVILEDDLELLGQDFLADSVRRLLVKFCNQERVRKGVSVTLGV